MSPAQEPLFHIVREKNHVDVRAQVVEILVNEGATVGADAVHGLSLAVLVPGHDEEILLPVWRLEVHLYERRAHDSVRRTHRQLPQILDPSLAVVGGRCGGADAKRRTWYKRVTTKEQHASARTEIPWSS